RRLAADHGRDHVVPDEAQPAAAGPDPEDDLRLDADHLHLHACGVFRRPCDLLGLEQHALGDPAEPDHAQARRQDRTVRQYQGLVREKEGAWVAPKRFWIRLPLRPQGRRLGQDGTGRTYRSINWSPTMLLAASSCSSLSSWLG